MARAGNYLPRRFGMKTYAETSAPGTLSANAGPNTNGSRVHGGHVGWMGNTSCSGAWVEWTSRRVEACGTKSGKTETIKIVDCGEISRIDR